MNSSVVFKNVTKKYKMYKKTSEKILDLVMPNGYGKDFYALQSISFSAEKGDIIGIIGVNGAGKSTLSNLISGVIPPSEGTVKINGDASLISIGAGLNNQLTGRENIELKCLMLGFTKDEIKHLMPEIIEFADIGEFVDQPVKSYSSGMKSRLGFAISVNINPDILVIDEALSVGDKTFAQKCLDKMNSFKEKGKTIFFISHSIGQVKEFCQKALWLEAGEVKDYGTVEEVLPKYEQWVREFNKLSKEDRKKFNQQLMEKRSTKAVIDDTNTTKTRRSQIRKKSKPKERLVNFLLIFVLIIASLYIYFKWDEFSAYLKSNKQEQKQTNHVKKAKPVQANPAKEKTDIVNEDIRYIQVITGFFRDKPDLSTSKKIGLLNFGDPIHIEKVQKDPVEDFNWLEFTLDNGQQGWVSEKILAKIDNKINDNSFIANLDDLVQVNQFPVILTNLGKSQQDLQAIQVEGIFKFTYNSDGQAKEVSFDINGISSDQIKKQLGEPILRADERAFLYHGEQYDFIFYSTNSVSFNKMSIKLISNNNDTNKE
jgi:teichoic acid transport system ATP-binding protein